MAGRPKALPTLADGTVQDVLVALANALADEAQALRVQAERREAIAEQLRAIAAPAPTERYATPEQAATLLQVHVNTVYRAVREGRLPAVRIGQHEYRIALHAIRPDQPR
jgi:excisionase family DNA binding protein